MKHSFLTICLLASCSLNALAQRNSIKGMPDRRDIVQVVNTLVYDSRTGLTKSPDSFGIVHQYSKAAPRVVASMYVPHSGNMRLTFDSPKIAWYRGDARQKVCKSSSPAPTGDWRTVQGTLLVQITTLDNGRRHVRSWFTPDPRDRNAKYAVSGLVFEFTLRYGDVQFRFNY